MYVESCCFMSHFHYLFEYIAVLELPNSSTRAHELDENDVKLELASYRESTTFGCHFYKYLMEKFNAREYPFPYFVLQLNQYPPLQRVLFNSPG